MLSETDIPDFDSVINNNVFLNNSICGVAILSYYNL